MIVVVDGTGPDDDNDYAREMGNSFCSQIAAYAGGTYFRGPTMLGQEVSSIADRATGAAVTLARQGRPVLLAGYSRGGCTVINAAYLLKSRGVDVAAMFLFDAVDMQTSTLNITQVIPSNVAFVAHARSARNAKFWVMNPVKSRWYFVNTGRWLAGNGQRLEESFVGTHGAAGGVPWPDVTGDDGAALKVGQWMTPHLNAYRIGLTLKVLPAPGAISRKI
jgi:hypothetical protein